MSSVTISAHHAGLNRAISGAQRVQRAFATGFSAKSAYAGLTAVAVLVAVTSASRALDTASASFGVEAFSLGVVALATFLVMIGLVVPLLRVVGELLDLVAANHARSVADDKYRASAEADPRIMAELNAARARQTSTLFDIPRATPAWHQLQRYW